MNIPNNIQVSVCIVTYNQEKYIAECLESLVTQRTNFSFEIIVGEDCSTDNTRSIVKQYVEKYPELIVPLLYDKNVGAVENVKQVYQKAKGKYIAHLDGDDLALPNKLQKQFDILENNSDCIICAHNMLLVDQFGKEKGLDHVLHKENKYNQLDLYLIHTLFRHSSKMFLNNIDYYIHDMHPELLDIELHIIQATYGNIYMLEETLGKYRENVGITFKDQFMNPQIIKRVERLYETVDTTKFTVTQNKDIRKKYAHLLLSYAYLCSKTIQDEELYSKFVKKSLSIYKLTIYQVVFMLGLLKPKVFFKLVSITKSRK